jgi:hypothetical protein
MNIGHCLDHDPSDLKPASLGAIGFGISCFFVLGVGHQAINFQTF